MAQTIEDAARGMWRLLEPVHAAHYYAPQAFEEAAALGIAVDDRWPSYFAYRAAPLGAAGAGLVTAAFFTFAPAKVAAHVPAVWRVAAPEEVGAARLRGVDRTLRALLGDGVAEGAELRGAASLARRAAEAAAADAAGRPMAAAQADLVARQGWDERPHVALWQAATVLREHRGDGHLAALHAAELDPVEALVSFAAVGAAPAQVFASRGWTDQEWAAGRERLRARGWVDADGLATARGRAGRAEVEALTDRLAARPWSALGPEDGGRLAKAVLGVLPALAGSGLFPEFSTLGLGRGARVDEGGAV
ncbi:hypothetical protein BIV57_14140 [Mangrovactinospora gilvigrisea]|uniref:SalK n=1 Tax=Mangrovactinospora gilvigrisea TaxID=1428644 RepID=A0A1J7BDP8_9ACTN|nr:hypothetical protein [Mangrovactinospora gilvigrisea]OIV36803.1 hypothetical protein BIV57_14140 [Mangrovactinospora gilvigrisea]